MRTMRARFQPAQVQRIIATLPAIESLAADAEVTAGTGRVVTLTIEIHPGQPNRASRLSSTPIRASRLEPGGFPLRTCISTLYASVTNHSEREQERPEFEISFAKNRIQAYSQHKYPRQNVQNSRERILVGSIAFEMPPRKVILRGNDRS
jgi:hypothetical protein